MIKGKKVILAVSGSIAAYKAVYLLRLLKKAGAEVQVVTTPSVSHFIGELSFSSLSGREVFSGLWNENWSAHVEIGTWADLMIVAPATANTLAKMAHGLCDNALLAVYLAARCPVLIAPAMDADMYIHPSTTQNLKTLASYGNHVLPTGIGFLASGLEGPGRLMEPDEIFQEAMAILREGPLLGKKVLITAGPTQEAIDPVRFISNHSTGKMGYALAATAQKLGAEVTLVSGPTSLPDPAQVNCVRVKSAQQMYEAVHAHLDQQDILIMSAAVGDYRPQEVAKEKIKKKGDEMVLTLVRTQDILSSVGAIKRADQLLIGFALETENEEENALGKLRKKNLDLIVLNSLKDKGAGFAHDTNQISLIDKKEEIERFPLKDKSLVAEDIFQKILQILSS
jgi:phosphopantothenoylcysteine decarboxylase/phosphopantothenate--cysteine ligase